MNSMTKCEGQSRHSGESRNLGVPWNGFLVTNSMTNYCGKTVTNPANYGFAVCGGRRFGDTYDHRNINVKEGV